ncbi:MAG: PH domain-containing protein [Dehalococcoidia bacterium]|nr:PH domain-containing protein [Dehalococcoidia bacterium]
MLLKGQGLTIERPPRAAGTLVGAGASVLALILAALLLLKVSGWPVSFPQFLGYAGAGLLILLAAVFGFWAYACAQMRYLLDAKGLTIAWGTLRHVIPVGRIEGFAQGRGEQRPRISGVGWWGYHVGRGHMDEFGRVLFFSTHRSPEELVYVRTADATYALSPRDPDRFIAEARRLQSASGPAQAEARAVVQRHPVAIYPVWADRVAQWLGLAAVLLNLALWGYVFAVYPDLQNQITIEFPPLGDISTLQSRSEIFKIPATATAILGVNLLAGLGFQWKERAATYLLLSGAIFFQVLFWLAAAIAVINA